MLSKEFLAALDREQVSRYLLRLERFGVRPQTLGWDRSESQAVRFATATKVVDFFGKRVLDIGCGFADFANYLFNNQSTLPVLYKGIDINPELVGICKRLCPEGDFEVRSILRAPMEEKSWDIVTMFGVLNLRLEDVTNEQYAQEFISEAFRISNDVLVVDMLSSHISDTYPREDFVYYYEPSRMLDFAFKLTKNVSLIHDYCLIPQREFMLVLRRSPCG